jgi:hypothetical protein
MAGDLGSWCVAGKEWHDEEMMETRKFEILIQKMVRPLGLPKFFSI